MEKFEERIFDIMNKHYDSDHPANSFLRSAKEIAQIAYPVAFVEWKDKKTNVEDGVYYFKGTKAIEFIRIGSKVTYSLSDLFTYWWENIHTKK